jgi:hypothetical protein
MFWPITYEHEFVAWEFVVPKRSEIVRCDW